LQFTFDTPGNSRGVRDAGKVIALAVTGVFEVPKATGVGTALGVGTIEDCRRVFQPLTRLGTCCTYRVGDGIVSRGDFTSIQAAVDALPPEGGKICVLPGTFLEAVRVVAVPLAQLV